MLVGMAGAGMNWPECDQAIEMPAVRYASSTPSQQGVSVNPCESSLKRWLGAHPMCGPGRG